MASAFIGARCELTMQRGIGGGATIPHSKDGKHVDQGRERPAVPRRRRCADGPVDAPALDAGVPDRGSQRARRNADQGARLRRGSGGVSRHRGPRRRDGRILSAPAGLAGVRAQRRLRVALSVSRLENGRARQRAGDGFGARGQRHAAEGEAPGVPDSRVGRNDLGVHGAAKRNPNSSRRRGRPLPTRG